MQDGVKPFQVPGIPSLKGAPQMGQGQGSLPEHIQQLQNQMPGSNSIVPPHLLKQHRSHSVV